MKPGIISAILAAFLFGISTPLIKIIVTSDIPSILLAGILYFGVAVGMAITLLLQKTFGQVNKYDAIAKSDRKYLLVAITCGGILAPVFMMMGIKMISATNVALLFNLEGVFTALLAWLVFKEKFNQKVLLGIIFIVLGGVVLSLNEASDHQFSWGSVFIILSCFLWGCDNNFTRKISLANPIKISALKGTTAAVVNLGIGYFLMTDLPSFLEIVEISVIGFFCYGLSLFFFIHALSLLGAARSGAYFGVAPFIGAVASVLIFHEAITTNLALSATLMLVGLLISVVENRDYKS